MQGRADHRSSASNNAASDSGGQGSLQSRFAVVACATVIEEMQPHLHPQTHTHSEQLRRPTFLEAAFGKASASKKVK
jgi:hypothetical protein